jgi:hypothetical protein
MVTKRTQNTSDVKKGWLMKCSKESGKNWRKRYFVLTGNTMNYYVSNKKMDKTKGNVLIVGDGIVKTEDSIETKGKKTDRQYYGFRFTTPFESILFLSISSEDRASWMRALEAAVELSKRYLRGYMLKRVRGGLVNNAIRKFFVLHNDVLTHHKDHESTKEVEFEMHIDKTVEVIADDNKWKIKLEQGGKRLLTIQWEQRSSADYPIWKDAIMGMKMKTQESEAKALEKTTEALEEAVQKGDLKVRRTDLEGGENTWEGKLVAFTDTDLIITPIREGAVGTFFRLTAKSAIIRTPKEETGVNYSFQVTTSEHILHFAADSDADVQKWIDAIQSIIPAPVVDQEDILLRAAINKLKEDEFYDVEIIDKKALGVVFKPIDNWAVVKDFDGYDPTSTGIYPGSVLVAVNNQDTMFTDFGTTTHMIQEAFQDQDSAMKLTFRKAPQKAGYLNKRSAGRKGTAATWHQRYFELRDGKLTIAPTGQDGNTEQLEIPLKDAVISLVPYTDFMVDNCFRIQIGLITLVLQGSDLADCIDWAATLTHSVALANGGQHITAYETGRAELEHNLQEALAQAPPEFIEDANIAPCVDAIMAAVASESVTELQAALDGAYSNQKLVDSGHLSDFLDCAVAIINKLMEDAQFEEDDFKALQALVAPDEEQMRAIAESKAMEDAMGDMGGEDGDSDDEVSRDTLTPRATTVQTMRDSEIFGATNEQMVLAEDEGDHMDEAELRQIKALKDVAGPKPEDVGDPATEEDLQKVFEFFAKTSDETGEPFISVMNFCCIYRMVSNDGKGNLMAQMKIYNEFDSTKNGFLTEHDFVYGWFANAAKIKSNTMLVKLKYLVQGDTMMI